MIHRTEQNTTWLGSQWQSVRRKATHLYCALWYYDDPVSALVNCLGVRLSDRGIRYTLRNGLQFDMQRGGVDIRTINHVVCQDLYEPSPDFAIQDGWRVVDLGAHKGAFTVNVARRGVNVQVLAVEPEPVNFEFLTRNVELNGLSNVILRNAAVWSSDGQARLKVHSASWAHRVDDDNAPAGSDGLTVQTMTLHSLLQEIDGDIDLLKVDIEGAEFDVLYTSNASDLARVRRIAIEYHAGMFASGDGRSGEELAAFFRQHGFECWFVEDAHEHIFAVRVDLLSRGTAPNRAGIGEMERANGQPAVNGANEPVEGRPLIRER